MTNYGNQIRSFLVVLLFLVTQIALAADNQNDLNTHATVAGANQNQSDDTDGDSSDCPAKVTSPVLIHNGEFIWSTTDVVLAGRPNISLSRYYRSYDSREGIFGKGWSTRCEKALVRVIDYENAGADDTTATAEPVVKYVYRLSNGRRYEFAESFPGTFVAPDGLPGISLTLADDGSPQLKGLDGSIERYNQYGQLVAEIDRNGNVVTYSYENGVIVRMADTYGRFLALSYGSTGHVVRVTDHTGRSWSYAYNSDGSTASVTDPAGGTVQYEYVNIMRAANSHVYPAISRITDASGVTIVSVTYADSGRVESYTMGENTYTYSERRGYIYKVDTMGSTWSYLTDESGSKTEVYPATRSSVPERYEYNTEGQLTKYTDLLGTEFTQVYDTLGRLTSSTSPDGTTTIAYQGETSWPSSATSPTGRVATVAYDSSGNPLSSSDPAGNTSTMTWSAQGDMLSLTDPLGNRYSLTYNEIGLVTSMTDALDRTTNLTYDLRGNLISSSDPAGGTSSYTYDVLDRILTETDEIGNTTRYAYDSSGRMLSVTDPAGGVTAFEYDEYGRTIAEVRPDASRITYTYRSDNFMATMTDPREVITTYTYDSGKRLTRVTAGRDTYSYTYDILDRVTRASSGAQTISLTYDSLSRPLTETQRSSTTTFAYNAEGEMVTMNTGDEELVYGYNVRGLLASLTTPLGTHRYEHDAAGRLVSHDYPNGAVARMRYDAAGQLLEQDYSGLSGEIYQYSYDVLGRVIQSSGEGPADWQYTYDAASRLVSAQHEQLYSYQYDALGNRLENGGVYDAFNKLTENNAHIFTYDAAGSLISKIDKSTGEQERFEYNGFQRLTSYAKAPSADALPTLSATYAYDAFGRRVEKNVNRSRTQYQWNGTDLIGEFDSAGLVTRFRYDGGYAAVEQSISSAGYLVVTDRLRQPKALVSASDSVVVPTNRNDPFGAPLGGQDGVGAIQRQGLPGQYSDEESGIRYNMHRYYDPETGRYIRSDPIGLAGGINSYVYAMSNPTNFIDPLGLAVDGFIDGAAVAYSANQLRKCDTIGNRIGFAVDVVFAAIPFIPNVAAIRHLGKGSKVPKGAPDITKPYKRPSGGTTKAQRDSVQGKPCVDCGATTPKQYADHKDPLVKEYYRTGTIDKARMRDLDSVQPQCPTCSNKQGAEMSRFSRQQKKDLGL